ncbi:MAG: hypothetical protein NC253_08260 [Ruminococcus sp.]|nr:hypothetical protein [Ruminococcus sp.]MCM1382574.1 hypothetical protein [Muribaculaceae bacterium]MCM1479024.1 hypothetical protein [Muribaculaceae bacterium]
MTAFEIYSAVGGVGEDILEESEIMPRKKFTKIIPVAAAAACFAVLAVGISHTLRNDSIEQPVKTGTEISEVTSYTTQTTVETEFTPETTAEPPRDNEEFYGTMPLPFGTAAEGTDTGGDQNNAYYLPCNNILNDIPAELIRLRDGSETVQWLERDKLLTRRNVPDNINDYTNMYSFITHFGITREEAETALEYYLSENIITYDDLDVIFSGDAALITETYATKYSIALGEKIYTPEWLYVHPLEDYRLAGITPEEVLARVEFFTDIYFTDEARQAFSEKLSEFTGEQVYIKPMAFEEKENFPIAEDEAELVEDFGIYDEEEVEYP